MLSEAHRQLLRDAAITDDVIDTCGARSISNEEREGIIFLYRGPEEESHQYRPDNPGEGPKYLFTKGTRNFLNILRVGDGPVVIVEGTKQALAGASHAPENASVYGISGCTTWHRHDWDFVDGREVFVCFDGDAASNRDVYSQAEKFGAELKAEGASSVRFIQIPVDGPDDKTGLDDYLSDFSEDSRRRAMAKLMRRAENKPADVKPRAVAKTVDPSKKADPILPDTGGREMVVVNDDLKAVVDAINSILKRELDGREMFNYGDVLTLLKEAATDPLEEGALLRLISEYAYLCTKKQGTNGAPDQYFPGARLDTQSIKVIMSSAGDFTPLVRVVRSPFVRPDGTVCTTEGYDDSTQTLLKRSDGMDGVLVPDEPSAADVEAARDLLMTEWLGDLPFAGEGARANALALVITPFVRGLFHLAPMAVVDGLQMGVGKNLFADCVSILANGSPAAPMAYTRDDEETRKQITSSFRAGTDFLVFDEAHVIEGASLARALTSITYIDRVLGASRMAAFPNQATWIALGNQVNVNGDVARRVYWIPLRPDGANPQDRDVSQFRHEDLRRWTTENRARLISAVLVLVRAWFADGCPQAPRGSSLGSFEGWDKTVGGIVAHAGLSGFLSEVKEKRSESDYTTKYWTAHLLWLAETFGVEDFTTADVKSKAGGDFAFEPPPELNDTTDRGYARKLGQAYAKVQDRWFEGLRLVKKGMGHRSVSKWAVEQSSDGGEGRDGGNGGNPLTPTREARTHTFLVTGQYDNDESVCAHVQDGGGNPPSVPSVPSMILPLDLETRSVDEKFTHRDFVRLAGLGDQTTTDHDALVHRLNEGDEHVTGFNILGFDLVALARWHGLDYEKVAARTIDTQIVERHLNPVGAKGVQKSGFYSLAQAAVRHKVPTKTDDIRRLARKHRGFHAIPLDNPEYVDYLRGDLAASIGLYNAVKDAMADPYLQREHRVQTIMGRITLEGFRVDEELVWDRYQYGQDKLEGIKDRLHGAYGLPLDKAMPHRTNPGKEAVRRALVASGISDRWLEENWPMNKDRSLSLGKEVLEPKRELFAQHGKTEAVEICDAIQSMNGVRTVYGTIIDWLVDGRVHPEIDPSQSSGRWSVTKPGITVMGKRGGKHVERAVYLPEEGHSLVCFDLDQVDMRGIAIACGDPNYLKLFTEADPVTGKIDAHSYIARMVGLGREEAKACGHGWNYGASVNRLVAQGVERSVAEQFDREMHEKFPVLANWKNEVREAAGMLGFGDVAPEDDQYRVLKNHFGRPLRIERSRAYTQAPAQIGQSMTRDIVAEGLLRLPFEVVKMLRAVIHDEVVLSIPDDQIEEVSRIVVEAFTMEINGVPITCGSSKPGKSWADCYEK